MWGIWRACADAPSAGSGGHRGPSLNRAPRDGTLRPVSAYLIATGVTLIPFALFGLLVLSGVERGRRWQTVAHPVRAVRAMFAEPPDEDEPL
jgi:hypothetical protein